MLDYNFDEDYAKKYGIVCGTDEAGRGPLCGPVVAAAVVFPEGCIIEGLDDSKKLTEKKRTKIYDEIISSAVAYGIAESSPEEIDAMNILHASLLAMRRAVDIVREKIEPNIVLIDGNRQTDFGIPSITVVHGDAVSQSIAAASVLAKVTRDRRMEEIAKKYPEYKLEIHKGYPTPAHKLIVYEHGPTEIYRKTFLGFLERDRDKLEAQLQNKRLSETAEKKCMSK